MFYLKSVFISMKKNSLFSYKNSIVRFFITHFANSGSTYFSIVDTFATNTRLAFLQVLSDAFEGSNLFLEIYRVTFTISKYLNFDMSRSV